MSVPCSQSVEAPCPKRKGTTPAGLTACPPKGKSSRVPTPALQSLPEPEWQALRAAYRERVRPWVDAHRERRSRGEKHPVYDFLFDYYHFTPGQLERWHPGLGRALAGEAAAAYLEQGGYHRTPEGVAADPAWLKPGRREAVRWIGSLLRGMAARPPAYGCFGLHEWAMVYRTPQVRHAAWPLRYDEARLAQIVESLPIRCSHFDAFRFFTEAARPLNRLQPTRESGPQLEQPGCLHANMDLYKWAFKLVPFTPSEWIAEAFALALEIREIDMRASPYDLRGLGFEPIPVERAEGRAEYEAHQRRFSGRGCGLRQRLIGLCHELAGV